jgi:hypothetical protein
MSKWVNVVFAADCDECECCGEPYCKQCDAHYADCECPGPHQDDMYDYKEFNGKLKAKLLEVSK